MQLMDWHRCKRWHVEDWNCPYDGQEDHTDDDREQKVKQPPSIAEDNKGFGERRTDRRIPTIPLLRGVRELKRTQVPEPLREPIPFPGPPQTEPKPGKIAAITPQAKGVDHRWLNRYQQFLEASRPALAKAQTSRQVANSRAPVSSRVPSSVPVRSTSSAVKTAEASERALSKSLTIFVPPPRPHDIGVTRPAPATAPAGPRQQQQRTRPEERSTGRKIADAAATTLIGAGAGYLMDSAANAVRGAGGFTGRSAPYHVTPEGLRLAN